MTSEYSYRMLTSKGVSLNRTHSTDARSVPYNALTAVVPAEDLESVIWRAFRFRMAVTAQMWLEHGRPTEWHLSSSNYERKMSTANVEWNFSLCSAQCYLLTSRDGRGLLLGLGILFGLPPVKLVQKRLIADP